MLFRSKLLLAIPLFGIFLWFGLTAYTFFFDTDSPDLAILGIGDNGCYAGEVQCKVTGSDNYKVASISISLDDTPLVTRYKINHSTFEHAFPLVTHALAHGNHILKISARDASWRKNERVTTLHFAVDNVPLQAAFVKADGDSKVFQGRTVHLQFQVNKDIEKAEVKVLSTTYRAVPEAPDSLIYECFIPVKCDEIPNEYPVTIDIVDRVGTRVTLDTKLHVVMYPFKKQSLVLNKEKIKAENELGLPERALEQAIQEATQKSPPTKLWQGYFYVPLDMKGISTEFGTIRTTQERGRYPHNALDLIAAPHSVVWAPQNGIIVIKERYAHSGLTIGIDHGLGVITLFFHLESFADINVGDLVKKGNPVGNMGSTGYASGDHLHWEMRVNTLQVDPMQWTKQDF